VLDCLVLLVVDHRVAVVSRLHHHLAALPHTLFRLNVTAVKTDFYPPVRTYLKWGIEVPDPYGYFVPTKEQQPYWFDI